tara:strand:- start:103 stop:321 length:219 start_codon:yes stop_codon:yes gene_type:complete
VLFLKKGEKMKKIILLITCGILLSACNTTYVTPKGQRLLGNTAMGCVLGEVAFGACEEGAAIGAFTTVITDQ